MSDYITELRNTVTEYAINNIDEYLDFDDIDIDDIDIDDDGGIYKLIYDQYGDEMWRVADEAIEQYLFETQEEAIAFFKTNDLQGIYNRLVEDYAGEIVDAIADNIAGWL